MDERTRAQVSEVLRQARAEATTKVQDTLRGLAREAGTAARRWVDGKFAEILEPAVPVEENDDE